MAYIKALDIADEDMVAVTMTAADALRARGGNAIYTALEAKARAAAGKRKLTGTYTVSTDQDSGEYTATFGLGPE